MTNEEHNRMLGILHLVYGGLHTVTALMIMVFFTMFGALIGSDPKVKDPAAPAFMMFFFGIFGLIWLVLSLPSFVAGYGLLKRKPWTKIWAYIAGGLAGASFPLGTALCVYTFWFWSSAGGKDLYEKPADRWVPGQPGVLHGAPAPAGWEARNREHDYTYVPPTTPPDWRGN